MYFAQTVQTSEIRRIRESRIAVHSGESLLLRRCGPRYSLFSAASAPLPQPTQPILTSNPPKAYQFSRRVWAPTPPGRQLIVSLVAKGGPQLRGRIRHGSDSHFSHATIRAGHDKTPAATAARALVARCCAGAGRGVCEAVNSLSLVADLRRQGLIVRGSGAARSGSANHRRGEQFRAADCFIACKPVGVVSAGPRRRAMGLFERPSKFAGSCGAAAVRRRFAPRWKASLSVSHAHQQWRRASRLRGVRRQPQTMNARRAAAEAGSSFPALQTRRRTGRRNRRVWCGAGKRGGLWALPVPNSKRIAPARQQHLHSRPINSLFPLHRPDRLRPIRNRIHRCCNRR